MVKTSSLCVEFELFVIVEIFDHCHGSGGEALTASSRSSFSGRSSTLFWITTNASCSPFSAVALGSVKTAMESEYWTGRALVFSKAEKKSLSDFDGLEKQKLRRCDG